MGCSGSRRRESVWRKAGTASEVALTIFDARVVPASHRTARGALWAFVPLTSLRMVLLQCCVCLAGIATIAVLEVQSRVYMIVMSSKRKSLKIRRNSRNHNFDHDLVARRRSTVHGYSTVS